MFDKQDIEKKKFSTKGTSKRQNNIIWQQSRQGLMIVLTEQKTEDFIWIALKGQGGWPLMSTRSWAERFLCWVLPDGIHTEPTEFHDMSRRKLCVWPDHQQLFANKAVFFDHPAKLMTTDRLIWFGHSTFKHVDFQRPDWICSPLSPTF